MPCLSDAQSTPSNSIEDYFDANFDEYKFVIHDTDYRNGSSCEDSYDYTTTEKFNSLSWEGNRTWSSVEAWLFLPRSRPSQMNKFSDIPGIAPFTPCVSKFKASAIPRACFNPLDNVTLMLGVSFLFRRNH